MTPRSLLGLLFHADKAIDLVTTAHRIGVFERLDAGPASLGSLAAATGARPLRLYKFLDGLESLGLVRRSQPDDDLLAAEYTGVEPLCPLFETVLGESSIERNRDRYPWRAIHGRLAGVVAGGVDATFAWPPADPDAVAGFERSMALGCPPIIEALRGASIFDFFEGLDGTRRWLDVGGGDGTVAAAILGDFPRGRADVFNLPAVAPLVEQRAVELGLEGRLGFVGGDFLAGELPRGYDVMSFIRVLHDWPADVARGLLVKAKAALAPGSRLVICEEFRNPDRLAIQFFWTYFLIGVDACVSRLRELEWYRDALGSLGFTDICTMPGAFDVIVATRG